VQVKLRVLPLGRLRNELDELEAAAQVRRRLAVRAAAEGAFRSLPQKANRSRVVQAGVEMTGQLRGVVASPIAECLFEPSPGGQMKSRPAHGRHTLVQDLLVQCMNEPVRSCHGAVGRRTEPVIMQPPRSRRQPLALILDVFETAPRD